MKLQAIEIHHDEDVEDILWGGYRLIQKKKGFRFGVDAYLLANFTNLRPGERIIDLGTGTGIISFLLASKGKNVSITALDILPEMTDLVERSISLNGLANMRVVTEDLRNAAQALGKGSFSTVVSNPPYFPVKSGEHSSNYARAIARTEIMCSLEDLVSTAAQLLNYSGKFVFIHRPSRLPEIFNALKKYNFEPKRMRLVFAYSNTEPNLVLIEARKNAGQELRNLPPLIMYDKPGQYSAEIQTFFKAYREEA